MKDLFERAEEFVWNNARLLERRLFEFHFRSGSSRAVLSALRAYQNTDGGFGNALEPDIRCPESQPVPTQHALEILDVDIFRKRCREVRRTTLVAPDGEVPRGKAARLFDLCEQQSGF